MSQENVDKARNFITAYNRRDFDAALEFFDPDIDWVLPEHQSSDSARGPDEIRRGQALPLQARHARIIAERTPPAEGETGTPIPHGSIDRGCQEGRFLVQFLHRRRVSS